MINYGLPKFLYKYIGKLQTQETKNIIHCNKLNEVKTLQFGVRSGVFIKSCFRLPG